MRKGKGDMNLAINKIKPYGKNAKKHSAKQIKQVAESIKRFGFVQPIVIDKNNEVVIGHCRLEAAKLLGMKEAPVISVENLTEEEVKALRLADNKLNESEWDFSLAIEELKGLSDEMFELTGFDKDEFDGLDNAEQITELAKERDLDLGKYDVLTVEAPEAPRLKARVSFYTRNIDELNKLKEFFDCRGGVLDIDKLIDVIK